MRRQEMKERGVSPFAGVPAYRYPSLPALPASYARASRKDD